jgi:hypothetical protein
MARVLGAKRNKLTLIDNLGGGKINLYYRNPAPEEIAAFTNESLQRQDDEIVVRRGEARQKWGLVILEGFDDGDFVMADEESGKRVPISSDPESELYVENWKDFVVDGGADLIELLAIRVFEMPSSIAKAEEKKAPARKRKPGKEETKAAGE